jgi:polar amino acid transport system substrate-binding protein
MITKRGRTTRTALAGAVAALLVGLAGCSVSTGADSGAGTAAADGPMNVAVFLQYPPFRYQDANGDPAGLEIQMMDAIADRMGREVVYHNVPFDSIIPGIATGRYDFALGQMLSRPENVDQVDVLQWVVYTMQMLVPAGNPKGIDPAALCGTRLAAVNASNEADVQAAISANQCASAGLPAVETLPFPDVTSEINAVRSGQVDGLMIDPVVGRNIAQESGGALETVPGQVPELAPTPLGWVFPNDDQEFLPQVRDTIVAMGADGSWQQLLEPAGLAADALIMPPSVDRNTAP